MEQKSYVVGGEESVRNTWEIYPVVSARWTGEEETMQWISAGDEFPDGSTMGW